MCFFLIWTLLGGETAMALDACAPVQEPLVLRSGFHSTVGGAIANTVVVQARYNQSLAGLEVTGVDSFAGWLAQRPQGGSPDPLCCPAISL